MTALSRRSVLRAGLLVAGAGVLSACTSGSTGGANLVLPTDPRIAEAEARRHATGRTQTVRLTAQAGPVDLGGPQVTTWTYDGVLPGREIRVRAGDTIHAELTNRLVQRLRDALRLHRRRPEVRARPTRVQLGDPHPSQLPLPRRQDALAIHGVDQLPDRRRHLRPHRPHPSRVDALTRRNVDPSHAATLTRTG